MIASMIFSPDISASRDPGHCFYDLYLLGGTRVIASMIYSPDISASRDQGHCSHELVLI